MNTATNNIIPAHLTNFAMELAMLDIDGIRYDGEDSEFGIDRFVLTVGDWEISISVSDVRSTVTAENEEMRKRGITTHGGTDRLLGSVCRMIRRLH